jgi:predicted dienelactone hydrolase
VRLYLPAQASAARPVPLVVFSHGIGGSRRGYSYLGSHFAAEGYASLHLQHVGSDRSLWSAGSPLALVGRLQGAAQDAEAIARVHDLRFALSHVLGGEFGALLDGQRVVAAGHSYGANTTLLASGARVVRDGQTLDLREPRLRAAIVISAPPFYGESSLEPILGPVRVPSLHVSATEDVIRIPGYYSGPEDRVAVFDAIGSPRKTLALFTGGSHSMFTDRAGTGGVLLNGQVKAATKELATAFLRQVLEGDDQPLRDWPQRHAALLARFVTAG